MVNIYYYSPSNGGFYQSEIHNYIPNDAVEISQDDYESLLEGNSKGKVIVPGADGNPGLINPDPPTQEQYICIAEAQKSEHLAEVTAKIAPLQDAVDLEIASDDEKKQLLIWKRYRISIYRVDISTAPDIIWPEPPQE